MPLKKPNAENCTYMELIYVQKAFAIMPNRATISYFFLHRISISCLYYWCFNLIFSLKRKIKRLVVGAENHQIMSLYVPDNTV